MSVIEEAKKLVQDFDDGKEVSFENSFNILERIIKELEQQKAITEAAKFLVKVKRYKDTQPAQYLASWPIALRKIEEALDNLEKKNERR